MKIKRINKSSKQYLITINRPYGSIQNVHILINDTINKIIDRERAPNYVKLLVVSKEQAYIELELTIKIKSMEKYFNNEICSIIPVTKKFTSINEVIKNDYISLPEIMVINGKIANYKTCSTKLLLESDLSRREIEELLYKIY